MRDEKILMQVRESKQNLINYMNDVMQRTTDEQFRDDMRELRKYVERFDPCKNLKAVELDRKIRTLIGVYRDKRLKHDNILGKAGTESAVKADVYDEANKKMFDRLAVMMENMLTERRELDAVEEIDKKTLKRLSDFERTAYLNRTRDKENADKKWNVEATLLTFELERLQLFYERSARQKMKDAIYDEWDKDESNADSFREQLAALDAEIENLDNNEKIILKQIANHKELRGMLGNLDLETFIQNNQYAGEQMERVFRDVAGRTKEMQKRRKDTDSRIDVIVAEAKETRGASVPKQKAGEKDKYDLERERRKQMKLEREMGDVHASGNAAEKEIDNEKTGR